MVKETKYYDLLGVKPEVSAGELYDAYDKLAMGFGSNLTPKEEERYTAICRAYDVLSDPEMRSLYDEGGDAAIQKYNDDEDAAHNPMEFFSKMMASGFPGGPQRAEDTVHTLTVHLDELYSGTVRRLAIQKKVICAKCKGRGGKIGSISKCMQCHGKGMETHVQQVRPGLMQHIEAVCRKCKGLGEVIPQKDKCKQCDGRKIVRERKMLEIIVEKGMCDGQKIVLNHEGDQEPGMLPGNIIIVLNEIEHKTFVHAGNDLVMKMPIQLVEALGGFKRVIKTLDGRNLLIEWPAGSVIKPEQTKCVESEGMPIHENPTQRGRLIIEFAVRFPKTVALADIADIEKSLPPRLIVNHKNDCEEVIMDNFDQEKYEQEKRQRREEARRAYELDEPEYPQCPMS